jgi:S-adenosylmethionine synthetase
MSKSYLFTSESVSEGHPDKVADQISDAVLDACLTIDPYAKVACETLITDGAVVVAGELFLNKGSINGEVEGIVREVIRQIGYTDSSLGFDYKTCDVRNLLHAQSCNIRECVEKAEGDLGAGDQGMMFGYATRETPELMPLPIHMAHQLVQRQAEIRKSGEIPWLGPDAKSQVTVRYIGGVPVKVEKIVLSTQHLPGVSNGEIREKVIERIIRPIIPAEMLNGETEYLVNPSGRFEIGGPRADTGLTGRKIIVDTYGGSCPHGGGAFSGKDPTKVDRSASYAARNVAKTFVAAGLADQCTVQLAYAIGQAEPVSVSIDFHGTGKVDEERGVAAAQTVFDLRPYGIITGLLLRRPVFRNTAAYGHFGRELPDFTWEQTPRASELRRACGL